MQSRISLSKSCLFLAKPWGVPLKSSPLASRSLLSWLGEAVPGSNSERYAFLVQQILSPTPNWSLFRWSLGQKMRICHWGLEKLDFILSINPDSDLIQFSRWFPYSLYFTFVLQMPTRNRAPTVMVWTPIPSAALQTQRPIPANFFQIRNLGINADISLFLYALKVTQDLTESTF